LHDKLKLINHMKKNRGLFVSITVFAALYISCKSDDSTSSNAQLTAPSNLVATTISARQIELTWQDNEDNEEGFLIERSKSAQETLETVDTVGKNFTRFRATMLEPNTSYFFRVRTFRGTGESLLSNFSEATTFDNFGPWVELNSEMDLHFHGVAMTDNATGIVVGERGTILRTTNNGQSWTQPFSRTENALFDVMFLNSDVGVAVGAAIPDPSVVLRTRFGGTEWRVDDLFLQEDLRAAILIDKNTGVAVGENGTILKTSGELPWRAILNPANNDLFDVNFIDASTGFTVGSEGDILKTNNGGDSWVNQASGTVETLRGICFPDSNSAIIVGHSGTILHTKDGGANWASQESGTGQNLFAVSFASRDIGFTVGQNGLILATTDGGLNWQKQASGTTNNLLAVDFLDSNTGMIAGEYGTVLLTTVGGRN